MAKASESIEIKATPKKCYDVITDYESYPEFLKESSNVTIKKKKGNTAEVTFEIDVIKKIRYTLSMIGKPGKGVTWNFVEGDFMKNNEGEWILEETKKGVTLATYNIEISFGLLVPGSVSKTLISKSLPAMLKSFKKRIESL